MKRWLESMSNKSRLVLMTAGVLILSLVVVGGLGIHQARNVVEQRVVSQELPAVLANVRSGVEEQIHAMVTAGERIADNRYVMDWAARGEPQAELPMLLAQFNLLKERYQADVAFLVTEGQKHFYNQEGLFKTINRETPKDRWYYEFIASGQPYEINLDIDEGSGQLMAFVNYRVEHQGRLLGVAGVGMNLSEVVSMVTSQRIGQTGITFLVDNSGLVKIHPDMSAIENLKLQAIPGIGQLQDKLLNTEDFSVHGYERDGQEFLIAAARIPALDWYLLADLPKQDIFLELDKAFINVLLIMAAIAVILMLPLIWLSGRIAAPVVNVAEMLHDIGAGDGNLDQRLEIREKNELGRLADGFNHFVEKIQRAIQRVDTVAQGIGENLDEVMGQAGSTIEDVQAQQQRILQMASSIEEMRATIQDITQSAESASEVSSTVQQQSASGTQVVTQAVDSINRLSNDLESANGVVQVLAGHVDEIGGHLQEIRDVADKTNLLALNAAIEAARAGEQGRGFAVVADEVRSLATRSNNLTDEIQAIIGKLQSGASEAMEAMHHAQQGSTGCVDLASQAGSSFEQIHHEIYALSKMNDQVAEALGQQTQVVEEVAESANVISETGQRTLQTAEKTSASCHTLRGMTRKLDENMSQFNY